MTDCPQCHRRLLSHASAKCNWCGCEITDPAYRQRAAAEREAYFIQEAIHDAASLARVEAIGVGDPFLAPLDPFLDPFAGLPLGTTGMPLRPRPPVPPANSGTPPAAPSFGHAYGTPEPATESKTAPAEEPSDETAPGDRFRHLEL